LASFGSAATALTVPDRNNPAAAAASAAPETTRIVFLLLWSIFHSASLLVDEMTPLQHTSTK
jgi:hypothetical protein